MKKKVLTFWLIILMIVILGGFFSWFFWDEIINLFIGPDEDRGCEVIFENTGDNKVELVFFTSGVSKNHVNEYVDFFMKSGFFSNFSEKFNFYYAGESECEVRDDYLFCYSKKLIRNSAICPNDYIIVLSNDPRIGNFQYKLRSSAYMNVISLNIEDSKNILYHEFGHVFANLADEYVPSDIPWGSENCQKACEGFEEYGDLEGCYVGCSETDYYRSSELSVMRSLKTEDYGKLNSMILKEDLGEYE